MTLNRKIRFIMCGAGLVVACAPAPGAGPQPGPMTETVQLPNAPGSPSGSYPITYSVAPSELVASVGFGAKEAWDALPSVYALLSIPVDGTDHSARRISGVVSARRRFADQPLSRFVNCGTSLVGVNADNYPVEIRLRTKVDSVAPEASRIGTSVNVMASGLAGANIRCSTTGALEKLIMERLSARIPPQ